MIRFLSNTSKQYNKKLFSIRTISPAMPAFFCIAVLLLAGCSGEKAQSGDGNSGGRPGRPDEQNVAAIPVQVAEVTKGDISLHLMQTTTIEAERQVDIQAKVSSHVVGLLVEEGDRLRKGDILVKLDEAELKIAYMRAKAAFETDQVMFERAKNMREQKLVSEEGYETASLQYESSKAAYEEAKLQLEYTNVRSPIDAVVVLRNVELGQRVTVNQILFSVADFDPLRAKIYVPEKDMGRIFVGQAAKLTIEAQPGQEFFGVVKMISPIVDPSSGTAKVTIDIPESKGSLKPGMFASVFIITDTHSNTLIMPKKALILETDLDQVYMYNDGRANKTNLTLGFTSGEFVEVIDGLKEGDLVVTVGQEGLREGLPIRITARESVKVPETATDKES